METIKSIYKPDKNTIYQNIAVDLSLEMGSVVSTVELFLNGATVPFIARYRKEMTGGLDEICIRSLEEKLHYYADIESRKETILNTIDSQGKLDESLKVKIIKCRVKQGLEDLYLPYKPKEYTKASAAREKGLDTLAAMILKQSKIDESREGILNSFIDIEKGVETIDDALSGAADIIAETISEDAELRGWLRKYIEENGLIVTKVREDWKNKKSKYDMYYSFSEFIKESPSHRLLAIRRASSERVTSWKIESDKKAGIQHFEAHIIKDMDFLFVDVLREAAKRSHRKMSISLEFEVFSKRMQEAESEAIKVFSKNLRNLLLEPPAGHKVIMAIDPGYRSGCKVAVMDHYGSFREYKAIFPHSPQDMKKESAEALIKLIEKYEVKLIAIGNGSASRETMSFVSNVVKNNVGESVKVVLVSESGASIYSASEVAINEFPDLDITVRGAISIGRRLQDPLSELVKIDPKSIGVGQYQHDVNQSYLKGSLRSVVESCVNFVGVELNTASKELLSYVSGIGDTLAGNIVGYREKNGPFASRKDLLKVSLLDEKVFEQCAGFLRIRNSKNRLDNSSIHPESYNIVEEMSNDISVDIDKIIGNKDVISRIDIKKYVTDEAGIPTLKDILEELHKPGLDPRDKFESIDFMQHIQDIEDLKRGMRLTGKVTNVTNFGAFVDIGVHQDGLIHISNLSRKFIKDPHDVISVGDKIRVKILSIDTELDQIDLEKI